jgi:hypothetical protein
MVDKHSGLSVHTVAPKKIRFKFFLRSYRFLYNFARKILTDIKSDIKDKVN